MFSYSGPLGLLVPGKKNRRIPIETVLGGMRAGEHSIYSHPLNLAESAKGYSM